MEKPKDFYYETVKDDTGAEHTVMFDDNIRYDVRRIKTNGKEYYLYKRSIQGVMYEYAAEIKEE